MMLLSSGRIKWYKRTNPIISSIDVLDIFVSRSSSCPRIRLATSALSPLADRENIVVIVGKSPFLLTCDTWSESAKANTYGRLRLMVHARNGIAVNAQSYCKMIGLGSEAECRAAPRSTEMTYI